jgi:hypothetical protein
MEEHEAHDEFAQEWLLQEDDKRCSYNSGAHLSNKPKPPSRILHYHRTSIVTHTCAYCDRQQILCTCGKVMNNALCLTIRVGIDRLDTNQEAERCHGIEQKVRQQTAVAMV